MHAFHQTTKWILAWIAFLALAQAAIHHPAHLNKRFLTLDESSHLAMPEHVYKFHDLESGSFQPHETLGPLTDNDVQRNLNDVYFHEGQPLVLLPRRKVLIKGALQQLYATFRTIHVQDADTRSLVTYQTINGNIRTARKVNTPEDVQRFASNVINTRSAFGREAAKVAYGFRVNRARPVSTNMFGKKKYYTPTWDDVKNSHPVSTRGRSASDLRQLLDDRRVMRIDSSDRRSALGILAEPKTGDIKMAFLDLASDVPVFGHA